MARDGHGKIGTKLRPVDFLGSKGKSVAEAIRSIGLTELTYIVALPRLSWCCSPPRCTVGASALRYTPVLTSCGSARA